MIMVMIIIIIFVMILAILIVMIMKRIIHVWYGQCGTPAQEVTLIPIPRLKNR